MVDKENILRIASEAGFEDVVQDKLERFVKLFMSEFKKPLSDEQIWKIIEEQSAIMGWKVPPTKQVARAVERAHGIGE